MKRTHRISATLAAFMLASFGLAIGSAGSALAASDNSDPYDTGCWGLSSKSDAGDPNITLTRNLPSSWDVVAQVVNGAYIFDNFGDYLGYVENWYSYRCGTNWARIFVDGGSNATLTVRTYTNNSSTDTYTTYGSYAWSNQVNALTATAYAYGKIYFSSSYQGTAIAAR
jgi:hypothetical protein